MPTIRQQIAQRLPALAKGPLARGFGAFGGAEMANRVVRLLTTVVIARQLTPDIVGEAALALTLFELIRVLARNGIGHKIIAAPAELLAATCNTAGRAFWQWSCVLIVLQLVVAGLLAACFGQTVSAGMLAVLSLVYLFMPGGLVQCHLALRDGLAPQMAKTAAAQAIADHLLTAVMLLIWPSPWSIALPKLLTAPIWLVMTRRIRPWQADPLAGFIPLRSMLGFSAKVLAAESMVAARTQGDKLVVAAVLGTGALGTYYFAFNAGIGIVASLAAAFGTVIYPLFCKAAPGAERLAELRRSAFFGLVLFIPAVALQALAAPWYVPLVFGQDWAFAAPLIAVLCLGGLSTFVAAITAQWLRAEARAGYDAAISLVTCCAALGGLTLGALSGSLIHAAAGLVAGQAAVTLYYALRIFGPALRGSGTHSQHKEELA